MNSVSASEAQKLIVDVKPLILDVRTEQEYMSGYISGAKLIPVDQLAGRISEIAAYKDKELLVYCHSGSRSLSAQRILAIQGFSTVHNLAGGMMAWRREGFEVTSS